MNRSTTLRMASKYLEDYPFFRQYSRLWGRSVTKSKVIDFHGLFGTMNVYGLSGSSKGCKNDLALPL